MRWRSTTAPISAPSLPGTRTRKPGNGSWAPISPPSRRQGAPWRTHSRRFPRKSLRRVVGFFGKETYDLIAVGVLVAPDLVLTCRHVVEDPRFEDAVGRAHSSLHLAGADQSFQVRRVVHGAAQSNLATDLALVEVKRTSGPPVQVDSLVIEPAPPRNTPIYILAMHRQDVRSLAIYDSASVLFPARVRGASLAELYADTILGLGLRIIANELTMDEARRLRIDLETAYGTTVEAAKRDDTYRYQRALTPGSPMQVFGFGTDTVQGNSGGGIFSKATGHLVGLIAAGITGHTAFRTADWTAHELGVPGEVVGGFLAEYLQATTQNADLPKPKVTLP